MIKKGDKVLILKAFQDEGDEGLEWMALCDEEKDRVDISPTNLPVGILPVYTVKTEWLV